MRSTDNAWDPKEQEIQGAILHALRWHPQVDAWRQNTGVRREEHKGKTRFIRYGESGCADISGVIRPWGVRLEIEVKRRGKKQSEAQKRWQERMEKSGAVYFVADSVSAALTALENVITSLGRDRNWTAAGSPR